MTDDTSGAGTAYPSRSYGSIPFGGGGWGVAFVLLNLKVSEYYFMDHWLSLLFPLVSSTFFVLVTNSDHMTIDQPINGCKLYPTYPPLTK